MGGDLPARREPRNERCIACRAVGWTRPRSVQRATRARRREKCSGVFAARRAQIDAGTDDRGGAALFRHNGNFTWSSKTTFMAAWVEGRVAGKRQWTKSLVSLLVNAPEVTFVAGQFARLALPAPPDSGEAMLGRPYSFVNPPQQAPHEFYFIVLPEGPLTPRLAALEAGDPIWLAPRANGFFSISEIPKGEVLWCLCTGTGIGPFLSMLRTEEAWTSFERIVLVHAVRHAEELTYREEIASIARTRGGAFGFVPMVSREQHPGALSGRIPAAIEDGRLEARAGIPLTPSNSHAMLCGNPAMVEDTQKVLAARGLRRHRRREPGHFTVETYW